MAKRNRRNWNLLGNRLDFWVRQGQDQQTRGIPIGPDTSLVLAEILLTAIDIDLTQRLGRVDGFRAIDDYELMFPTLGDAENAFAHFQSVLESYELRPNGEKTRIVELPQTVDDTWPVQLRRFQIRGAVNLQGSDILDFFNLAFELAIKYPQASVLRYAVSRTSSLSLLEATWPIYQDLLLQCANTEPGTLPHVTAEIRRYRILGFHLDHDQLRHTIEQLVSRHDTLGHGSEVAWAVWLAIATGTTIGERAAERISRSEDPLVPLLALHANAEGLIHSGLDTTAWEDLMRRDELWGDQWLLCYEANVKGWLPSRGGGDHVLADPCFAFLKTNAVSFYNTRASALRVPRWTPRRPSGRRFLGLQLTPYEV